MFKVGFFFYVYTVAVFFCLFKFRVSVEKVLANMNSLVQSRAMASSHNDNKKKISICIFQQM